MLSLPFLKGGKSVIGLDLGSSYVKLLELTKGRNGYQAKAFGVKKLPPEAIVDGALMNSTVIVEAIRELVDRHRIRTKDVVTSVSGHSVIIKKITLPSMTQEELEESILWEAEQYIPFNIDEVNIDAQILSSGSDDSGQMEVLLVAAKKELISDYVSVITEAGLQPAIIDVDAFAIENMFEMNHGMDEEGTVVLVDIGASFININVIRRGVTAFTRDISPGGNQFTEEIQKQLNVSYEEAEALKIGGDVLEDTQSVVPQEVENIMVGVSENVAAEIQRSLDFYSATSTEDRISKVYLSGGSAMVPGLTQLIEDRTGVPVEILNPFQQIEVQDKIIRPEILRQIAPMAAVVVGLAIRKVGDK